MKKPTDIIATRLRYSTNQALIKQKPSKRSGLIALLEIGLLYYVTSVYFLMTFKPHRKTTANNLAILFKYDTEKRQIYLK